ncbi:MAG: hypothetical protein MJE63_09745 [Proteobacteria bacterium]|nr:hypothetical protein [Pseudomonadota bacterium]
MEDLNQFSEILILSAFVVLLMIVLTFLVLWARKTNKGANLIAAAFTFFAPDPLFQKNYKMIQETENRVQESENESEDPLTSSISD